MKDSKILNPERTGMNMKIHQPLRVVDLFPYFLLIVAGLGIGATFLLRKTDLTITSLILVVPMVLAAVILLVKKNVACDQLSLPVLVKISFSHLFLTACLILIISVITLITSQTRTLAYFMLMSVYSGLILLQAISLRSERTNILILAEIMLLSLNLVWGVSLKYPLYFGDTDVLIHLRMIDNILGSGYITSFLNTYQNYPLYHIFIAMGSQITGLPVNTALFAIMGLAWQAGILLAFLIFRDLSRSSKLALVAALFFASTSQIIFYGGYAIARSLAFVMFLAWFYLILRKTHSQSAYLVLSLIVMPALIMMHHLNVIFIIPTLIIVYICQIFFRRRMGTQLIDPLFIYLFTICSVAYLFWTASDMSDSVLPSMIGGVLASITSLITSDFTGGYGLSILWGTLYYSFVLLFSFLGIKIIFSSTSKGPIPSQTGVIALAGLVMLVLFVPGPVQLFPSSSILMLGRFQLIFSPFITFLMAYGIYFLLGMQGNLKNGSTLSLSMPVLTLTLVVIMTLFSTISTGNAQDYDYFPHTATIDTPYFKNSELESFTFLQDKADLKLTLYGDYQTVRNEFLLGDFQEKNIISNGDTSYIQNGYLALRISELQRKQALTFAYNGYASATYRYHLDAAQPEENILFNLASRNRIYSSKAVEIFNMQ